MSDLTEDAVRRIVKEAFKDFHGADEDITVKERLFLQELMEDKKRQRELRERLKQSTLGYLLVAFLGGLGTLLTYLGIKAYELWIHLQALVHRGGS